MRLGGTAGCVLASRLSEDPDVSVLVLEKGHVKDNLVSRIPLLSQNMFLGDPLQVQSTRWSEPIPEANGRRTRIWTSEGLGGATRINAMLMTRGCRADYIAWSKELGLSDWGWEQVEPYFRKIENAVEYPESKARGHEGKTDGTSGDIHRILKLTLSHHHGRTY
jgi:choline dehydrogenase-like flavoprotein